MADLENHGDEKHNNPTNKFVSQDNLKRTLKNRHMSMIAIGGTIGTGLFVASGTSLASAGPAGSLLAYSVSGIVIYFVMTALAEMSTFIPIAGSFNSFADRFVDPSFGFAIAYNYWYSWIVTAATDIVAAGIIMKYWVPKINPILWSILVFLIVVFLNLFGARLYGEIEFWLSLIKVIAIIIFIIIGTLTASGVIGGTNYGFSNWKIEGAPFVDGFGGTIGVFIFAGFAFQGTEIIGITAGESKNPSRDVPKAIKSIFWRILLFYVLTVFLIGLIVPYDNENLLKSDIDAVAISPLVLVLLKAGINAAPDIMNAIILTSVLSAGNSGLYLTTRALYSLAIEGKGPKLLTKVSKQGTPIYCLAIGSLVTALLCSISLIGNNKVYVWFVAVSGVAGFLSWTGILFTYWRFRRAYIIQGYSLDDLPYVSGFYPFGPAFSFVFLVFIILAQGYESFIGTKFDASKFLQAYLGIPLFLIPFIGYKFIKKTKLVPLNEIDLETDNYLSLGFENVRHQKTTVKDKLMSIF
ncbi:hypothetical protein BB561_006279 [Smittium simulii]|uniref:Amino acid permease/ SLC12A domain-containing protein n=1 Tax=Smittium simulii TaxID=133385 RepID=A0A2T9Y5F7_9FUNG|nr:hypothetical protein BB561_006279 [Smittium simulii]